jgi:hypothetical protein
MSVSGFKKLYARYRRFGFAALEHGLAGKPPNKKPHPHKEKIIRLANGKYKSFNISHTCELLRDLEDLKANPETLRLWLIAAGRPAGRRKTRHRKRRQPKQSFGEMLQIDGSFHDWLGDGKRICMINITDDATSTAMLHFNEQETIEAVCRCLWRWVCKHGIPKSIYADGRNMYHLLSGKEDNFFTGMCRRLGIQTIRAYSPQAKGRVERANGTHQSRLVPTLELLAIKTIGQLNEYVVARCEAQHNKRFSHAAPAGDCHRPLPKRFKSIDEVCWTRVQRTINNDWTVRYENQIFQIPRWSSFAPAKSKVIVTEAISGKTTVQYRDATLKFDNVSTF